MIEICCTRYCFDGSSRPCGLAAPQSPTQNENLVCDGPASVRCHDGAASVVYRCHFLARWPGYVKGAEFTAIDVLALAIFLSQPATRHWLPFLYSIVFYFIAVLFSALMAQVPMASLFFAWQLIRIFLVFFIVTRACSDERNVSAMLTGMAIGICLEVVSTVWQRFGLGVLQTGGTVGEKNLLGLMSQFVGMPWFALLLAGRRG